MIDFDGLFDAEKATIKRFRVSSLECQELRIFGYITESRDDLKRIARVYDISTVVLTNETRNVSSMPS